MPGFTKITGPDGTVYESGQDYIENSPHRGTITLTPTSPIPVQTTMTFQFLAGSISRWSTEPATAAEAAANTVMPPKQTQRVNILSTVRPKAPDVHYVVPAHSWSGWAHTSTT